MHRYNGFKSWWKTTRWIKISFDQLAEIVDAVGDKLDVICEGGIQRGTHMLKALSLGAKACSGGRLYLYALAAAGQAGVERAIEKYKAELVRDMKLMGCTKISDLNRNNLRFRKVMSLKNCHNFEDFRKLSEKKITFSYFSLY